MNQILQKEMANPIHALSIQVPYVLLILIIREFTIHEAAGTTTRFRMALAKLPFVRLFEKASNIS